MKRARIILAISRVFGFCVLWEPKWECNDAFTLEICLPFFCISIDFEEKTDFNKWVSVEFINTFSKN
jgi:hypothetical protein